MQKIIPHLWFDTQGREAAEFYIEAFGNGSKLLTAVTLPDTPSGDAESIEFELAGYRLMAISGGPFFKPNPSISFMLNFDPSKDEKAQQHLDELWEKLSAGGKVLMPLQEYPFSKRYGWIEDKYGVSWQLILTSPEGEERPFIMPSFLFTNDRSGQAEAATEFYLSVFGDARRSALAHYPEDMGPNKKGTVMFTDFTLEGQWFVAMDGGDVHNFGFNEGVSLIIECSSQEEADAYVEKLSAVPEAEQCGWMKDRYGVSWQVSSTGFQDMMRNGTPEQIARVTKALLPMKRLDFAALEQAYRGA